MQAIKPNYPFWTFVIAAPLIPIAALGLIAGMVTFAFVAGYLLAKKLVNWM